MDRVFDAFGVSHGFSRLTVMHVLRVTGMHGLFVTGMHAYMGDVCAHLQVRRWCDLHGCARVRYMASARRSRGRASFGTIDRLPSGKWRARYTGSDRKRHASTFERKSDASAWLAVAQAALVRHAWRSPDHGRMTVGSYAEGYLTRRDLRPSTRSLYAGLWRLHLAEEWGTVALRDVTPQRVRMWHERTAASTRPTAHAQAYRLLRSILNVAVRDGAISRNPCQDRGAGTPKATRASRSLTRDEVQALAAKVPSRYRALVLVLAFGGLRFGEATALARRDVAPDGSAVRVERSVRYVDGQWLVGPPKTDAGRRIVALPPSVALALVEHLAAHVAHDDDALVFGTRSGSYLGGANWGATFRRAVAACGLPPVRVHELRHTGATLAAQRGATTADLMARFGHSTPAAAMVYQHAATSRDAALARALDDV